MLHQQGKNWMGVPPEPLRMGYGGPEQYISSGRDTASQMMEILGRHKVYNLNRILDYGCAAGRVMRHLRFAEVWGVDVCDPAIRWINQYLPSPPFHAKVCSEQPSLEFESDFFDFIYAQSVFSHLKCSLIGSYLVELARVCQPGGYLFITFFNEESIKNQETIGYKPPGFCDLGKIALTFEFPQSGAISIDHSGELSDVFYNAITLIPSDVMKESIHRAGLSLVEEVSNAHYVQTGWLLRKKLLHLT